MRLAVSYFCTAVMNVSNTLSNKKKYEHVKHIIEFVVALYTGVL